MAKTGGVDDQVLSLPGGGGGVQGLGATFDTDLNTGTGSYSVPIDVPKGPNGVQPQVALRYQSAGANGPFGMGWTLGAMTIARTVAGRIPDYGPDDDQVTLVGVEELVSIGGGRYRPLVDTVHYRILRSGDGWEVTDPRGIRHGLGPSAASRVETVEGGLTKTAEWLLAEVTDTNGNAIRYGYLSDGAQRYLETIEWGTYALRFLYEPRPDVVTSGRYGFLLTTSLRCRGIELHLVGATPSLTRSWTLAYTQAPGPGLSLLSSVTLTGHAADGGAVVNPPLSFGYQEPGQRTLERMSGPAPSWSPGRFEQGRTELVDWNGDGLPDAVSIDRGRLRIWPNLGHGRWGAPAAIAEVPAPLVFDEAGVAFADMEGNGTADLVVMDRPLAGYYPLTPERGFGRPVRWRSVPAVRLDDPRARLVDLDGDGVTDLMVTGDDYISLYYRDDSAGGWHPRPQIVPRPEAPPVQFRDPHCTIADMNGDGLQDLVRIDGGGVTWWPYVGNGRWLGERRLEHAPELPRDYDPRRLFLVDVDGDGCADLVYVGADRVTIWFNQSGVRLSDPIEVQFTPFALPPQVRLADMKGSGTTGVVWSSVAEGQGHAPWLYLDLMGGRKPYLLTEVDNGLGLRVDVAYRPSTEFAIDAAAAGRPWRTFHPFPVQCVAEVRATDAVTGTVAITRNRYHEARYDGAARTFLGFAVVDVESVGDAAMPTLRTRNVYHLGLDPADPTRPLVGDEKLKLGALRRRLLRTEIYGLDGGADEEKPYQVVEHTFAVDIEPAAGGAVVLDPHETYTLETQWERGVTPAAFREISYVDRDEFGNITRQSTRTWRPGEAADDENLVTEATFARNDTAYVVALPARVAQFDAGGRVVALGITYYDGAPHVGLPEGQVDEGNVSRQEVLAVDDDEAAAVYGGAPPDWASLGYHRRTGEAGWWATKVSYGRPDPQTLVARGPRGHDTRLELDATRQYPSRLVNALGEMVTGTPEARVFQMGSIVDSNGHSTRDLFDALGRVTAVVKPLDSEALPSSTYEYHPEASPPQVVARVRVTSGAPATLDRYDYATGRGESLQVIVSGEGDPGREFLVSESREYCARGQLTARTAPYHVSSSTYAPPPLTQPRIRMRYDALGRLIEQTLANGSRTTVDFRPGRIVALDEVARTATPPRTLTRVLDGLKRTIAVEHQLVDHVAVARYEYDALGRLARYTAPGGGVTRTTFDLLGRIMSEESPDTGRTVFVHDAGGNQVARTNAAGQTMRNTVDELDRLLTMADDNAPGPDTTYTYLNPTDPLPPDGAQNRIGRVWKVTDGLGTLTYRYDVLGRVVHEERVVDALGRTFRTDAVYDAIGRQTGVTLPEPTPGAGRRVLAVRYDARGMPVEMPGFVRSAEYDAVGNPTRTSYGNKVEAVADYDPLTGRPSRLRVLAADATVLRDQTFVFDPAGNLQSVASPLALEGGAFAYDDWYHLTSATYGSGEHYEYEYSDSGNITDVAGVGSLTYAPGSSAVTQAGGDTYTYDTAGRLGTAPYGALHFDAFDNLRRIDRPAGDPVEFRYDHRGHRAMRSVGASQTVYVDAQLEFHDGRAVLWISFAGRRIAALSGATGAFVHTDWLGAYSLFTGLDGSLLRRVAYGPYGTLRFDSGAPATGMPDVSAYAGSQTDPDAGLLAVGRRFYDPRIGRFISPDRVVSDFFRIDAWNRYEYAFDNPLRYIDLTGYFSIGDFFAILAIVVVVAVLVVAGFMTGGATWAVAGVVISESAVLFATAAGVAVGAIIGGYAAYKAGGDLWKGILFGGFLGGVAAFSGGVLGAMAGSAVGGLFGGASFWSMVAAGGVGGAVQGALAGAATGAAIGFGGGKGSAALMWQYIWRGAAMGAITGLLLGAAMGAIQANPNLHIGLEKVTNPTDATSGLDTWTGTTESVTRDIAEGTPQHGWGLFVGIGPNSQTGFATVSVPIGWLPNAMFNYGGLSATTSLGVVFDKYGVYTFDKQLFLLLGALPFFIGTVVDIIDATNAGNIHQGINDVFSTQSLPLSG
jgi:RHS repeat-associated protein